MRLIATDVFDSVLLGRVVRKVDNAIDWIKYSYWFPKYFSENETVVQLSVSQTRYNLDLQIQMQRFISQ